MDRLFHFFAIAECIVHDANSLQVRSQATVSCSQPEDNSLLMSCQTVDLSQWLWLWVQFLGQTWIIINSHYPVGWTGGGGELSVSLSVCLSLSKHFLVLAVMVNAKYQNKVIVSLV